MNAKQWNQRRVAITAGEGRLWCRPGQVPLFVCLGYFVVIMLSRFAFRAGAASPALISAGRHRVAVCVVLLREYSSDVPAKKPPVELNYKIRERLPVPETIANWDAANKLYYGPERDKVNFPIVACPEVSPPCRLGFIPDTWFQFFYEKTGVTGPYIFGFGMITFLLSKEIWIVEHGFHHFLSFWFLFYILYRKFGTKIGDYLDNISQGLDDRHWNKPKEKIIEQQQALIKETENMIWREDGQKYLFEAKKENVDLQLESVYRRRLAEVHQAVKRRLDYHVDVDSARRRIEQQHMVQWIVDQVVTGITPQQEKDSLSKCIQDLKTLASQQPAGA